MHSDPRCGYREIGMARMSGTTVLRLYCKGRGLGSNPRLPPRARNLIPEIDREPFCGLEQSGTRGDVYCKRVGRPPPTRPLTQVFVLRVPRRDSQHGASVTLIRRNTPPPIQARFRLAGLSYIREPMPAAYSARRASRVQVQVAPTRHPTHIGRSGPRTLWRHPRSHQNDNFHDGRPSVSN